MTTRLRDIHFRALIAFLLSVSAIAASFAAGGVAIAEQSSGMTHATRITSSQTISTTCTAPATTTSGDYIYIAFKTAQSCTWTPPEGVTSVDYLVVAGGGASVNGLGGGGAGGLRVAQGVAIESIGASPALTVVVGAGGIGGDSETAKGGDSRLGSVVATGGGLGGSGNVAAGDGGSGGGAGISGSAAGLGVAGQGNNGGSGVSGISSALNRGGGGGGAGGVGQSGSASGNGGTGTAVSWITPAIGGPTALSVGQVAASQVYFGGGGGGGVSGTGSPGAGGLGGGGKGGSSVDNSPAEGGQPNTGGGAGALNTGGGTWKSGGSGVVVIRYLDKDPQAPLSIITTSGTYGSVLQLQTSGGSGTGSVSFATTNGTALGCAVSDDSLTVTQAGTCLVTATKAGDDTYTPVSSPQTIVTFAKAQQSALAITSDDSVVYGQTLALTTSGGSVPGAATFQILGYTGTARCSFQGAANLSGTTAGTGACEISAENAGNANYEAVIAPTQAVTVLPRPISIAASSQSIAYGSTVAPSISIASGSLAFDDSISGATYTYEGTGSTSYGPSSSPPVALGTYSVTPSAATFSSGSASNYSITYLSGALAITQATQSISFAAIADDTFGAPPFTASASATSGLPVMLTSSTPDVCVSAGLIVEIVGAGFCSLTASQPGNANVAAAAPVVRSFTVYKANQPAFVIVSDHYLTYGSALTVRTTGGAGTGAVTVSVTAGTADCTLTGAELTADDTGTCVVTASKAGDDNYNGTAAVTQTVTVLAVEQVITFLTSPPMMPRPGGTYAVSTTASSLATGAPSGLPVTLTITAGSTVVCTLSGGVITFSQSGTCVVTATQGGDGNYLAAEAVSQAIEVGRLNQVITFIQPVDKGFGSPAFALTATTSSGLPLDFVIDAAATASNACSVDDTGVVTILAVGSCGVIAQQAGNTVYAAASSVTRVFQVTTVTPSAPYITGVNVQNGGATLTFNVPGFTGGAPLAGYQVNAYPDGSGTPITFSGCPTSAPLVCTIPGLVNGVSYRFTVQAINSAGAGAESPLVPAIDEPAIISVVRAAAVGSLVAWKGDTTLTVSWTPLSVAQLGGGAFDRYVVSLAQSATPSVVDDSVTLTSQSDASHIFTGLTNGTAYTITVVSYTTVNATQLTGNTSLVTEIPARVPDRVVGSYVPTSGTSGVVSWSPPVSDGGSAVTRYRIRMSLGGVTVFDDTAGPSVLFRVVTGLTRGVTYAVTMTVANAVGSSDDTRNATQPNVPAAPSITAVAPATVDDSSGFKVTWTVPADNGAPITGYQVTATRLAVRSTSLSAPRASTTYVCTSSTNTCMIFAPGSVRDYSYVVNADNLAGVGPDSAPFVVPDPTPPGPGPVPPVPTPPSPQPVPGPVPPGTTFVEVDGRPDPGAIWGPNPEGTGLDVSGSDYSMRIRAVDVRGVPVPIDDGEVLVAYTGERIEIAGSGFRPGTYSATYVLNPVLALPTRALPTPVRLGTVLVSSRGSFTGSWRLPPEVLSGQYILQVVSTLSPGSMLTVDTGLIVRKADRRSIVIAGNRGKKANAGKVFVFGRAWDLNGEQVWARVKLQGEMKYVKGSSRTVKDGKFTWQRKTGKKVYVYFQSSGVRSNRIIIGKR